MNNIVGAFEKVSYEQFKKDLVEGANLRNLSEEDLRSIYDGIMLPKRATEGSAGYDFFLPYTPMIMGSDKYVKIYTGVKCRIEPGWALFLYPKSGIGSKYGVSLRNTVGVVDSDYYFAKNEGHIIINLISDEINGVYNEDIVHIKRLDENDSKKETEHINEYSLTYLQKGKGFVQGIFMPFGVTEDDENVSKDERIGGFGSTSKD